MFLSGIFLNFEGPLGGTDVECQSVPLRAVGRTYLSSLRSCDKVVCPSFFDILPILCSYNNSLHEGLVTCKINVWAVNSELRLLQLSGGNSALFHFMHKRLSTHLILFCIYYFARQESVLHATFLVLGLRSIWRCRMIHEQSGPPQTTKSIFIQIVGKVKKLLSRFTPVPVSSQYSAMFRFKFKRV